MRNPRIFIDQPLASGTTVSLGKEAARHLVTVLRCRAGDRLRLFNGEGGEYSGTLVAVSPKAVTAEVGDFDSADHESPLRTLLGVGISRGERFEWVLQKATELGVSEIFPLHTERTEVKLKGDREDKKLDRWHQVLVSACEQCGRNRVPLLHPPQPFASWLAVDADIKLLLHHQSNISIHELSELKPQSVAMAIGPEGGLSPEEVATALNAGFTSLTIGPRVLRTETAPLVALTICQTLWGDF